MISSSSTLWPLVRKLECRSRLGHEEKSALLSLPSRLADFDRTSFIAREGERSASCTVLLSGFAICHKLTGNGTRQILSIHLPGDLLDPQNGRLDWAYCNVQPLSSVKAALIPRDALLGAAAAYPAISGALWADAGANSSILAEWLLNVGRRDARSRISHLIYELAVRQEAAGVGAGPRYAWPLTQDQLGDATGLTSVHVNRTMQRLRAEGLVRTTQREVVVLDWDRLCEVADFTPAYLQFRPSEDAPLRLARAGA